MYDYVSEDYLARVRAFLAVNRVQFVDDAVRARRYFVYTLPWVDPRSLIFAPSVDVEDVPRDALLLKLAGYRLNFTVSDLQKVHSAYMDAKLSVSDDFVVKFLREVKK